MNNKEFFLQADYAPEIGLGHVMRMFALGQILSNFGYDIHFFSSFESESLINMIEQEGYTYHNYFGLGTNSATPLESQFIELCIKINPYGVAFDGLTFDYNSDSILRRYRIKVIRISDIPKGNITADLLINPNLIAQDLDYEFSNYTKKALGVEYALLRKEFLEEGVNSKSTSRTKRRKKILVTLGGSNQNNEKLYEVFNKFSELNNSQYSIELLADARSLNMAQKMKNSDLAFVSAGITMWEAVRIKLPFYIVTLNEPQRNYIQSLQRHTFWIDDFHHDMIDVGVIDKVVKNFFIDPYISFKVIEKMNNLKVGGSIFQLLEAFLKKK